MDRARAALANLTALDRTALEALILAQQSELGAQQEKLLSRDSEMDNSAAEHALRTVALGRKNFLFAGSDAGGERAAAIYSLLGTTKLNGIDPELYLCKVLERIADHLVNRVHELLLWNLAPLPSHLA
jgi:hypothetical protein